MKPEPDDGPETLGIVFVIIVAVLFVLVIIMFPSGCTALQVYGDHNQIDMPGHKVKIDDSEKKAQTDKKKAAPETEAAKILTGE